MSVNARVVIPEPYALTLDCVNCLTRLADDLRQRPGVSAAEPDAVVGAPGLRYQYDDRVVSPQDITAWLAGAAQELDARTVHQVLAVEGMDCADCAMTLQRGVSRLDGVTHADVNFASARMAVEFDRTRTNDDMIASRVRELGYDLTSPDAPPVSERMAVGSLLQRRSNQYALGSGLLTLLGLLAWALGAPEIVRSAAWITATAIGGLPLALKGVRSVRATRSPDINLLMVLAAAGALAIGEYLEAATVVFLFSLGEALEGYAMDRVRRSVRALLQLAPPTALVQRGLREVELPVSEIAVGEQVIVRSGGRVPLDGSVLRGASHVDQSSITGESVPVAVGPDSPLFAGTLNGSGPLVMRVTRLAADSSVARVIRMVEHAQAQRAPVQRVVDRFARIYTPVVMGLAAAVAVVPPLAGGDWLEWLERALVLLVISCPCALVLSTPISIVSALSAAARNGVLVKGGAAIEQAGRIDTVAFDKTGTLTTGVLALTHTLPLDGRTDAEVLHLAAALEAHSEHPIGRAVVRHAQSLGIHAAAFDDEQSIHGQGIAATNAGQRYVAGTEQLFAAAALTPSVVAAGERVLSEGGTPIFIGTPDAVHAIIGVADTPRVGVRQALDALRAAGVRRIVMLSGDRPEVAQAIGRLVGVDEAHGALLPADKQAAIAALRAEGRNVAMVGDGVNDAPSLASADLGVAMGVAGSDAAVETADVALMGDDLHALAGTVRHGRRTRRIVAANIAISLLTKVVFLGLAVAGIATLWTAILADVGVSLLVCANGMRLLRWPGEGRGRGSDGGSLHEHESARDALPNFNAAAAGD